MRKLLVLTAVMFSLGGTNTAQAHLVTHPKCKSLECRSASQTKNLAHIQYVCHNGKGKHVKWHCKWVTILERELAETQHAISWKSTDYWIKRQIEVATIIGPMHADAWPNCPDPFDGGGYTWQDTVNCENGGNWYDSDGFYRCGLQFDPQWERIYGRLCP